MKKIIIIVLVAILCIYCMANLFLLSDNNVVPFYIIGAVLGLAISLYFCGKFAAFADEKGYSYGKYFALCFFMGIIGYIWVAALPNAALMQEVSYLRREIEKIHKEDSASNEQCGDRLCTSENLTGRSETTKATAAANGDWICGRCSTKNSVNYGQCKKCGCYRI